MRFLPIPVAWNGGCYVFYILDSLNSLWSLANLMIGTSYGLGRKNSTFDRHFAFATLPNRLLKVFNTGQPRKSTFPRIRSPWLLLQSSHLRVRARAFWDMLHTSLTSRSVPIYKRRCLFDSALTHCAKVALNLRLKRTA